MEEQKNENLKEKAKKIINEVKDDSKKFNKTDKEEGKGMAILSYIGPLALIPFLVEKKNKFVIYHAKQGMNLMILELILGVVTPIACIILFLLAGLVALISGTIGLLFTILSIIGIINVCNGEAKELPIINKIKLIK